MTHDTDFRKMAMNLYCEVMRSSLPETTLANALRTTAEKHWNMGYEKGFVESCENHAKMGYEKGWKEASFEFIRRLRKEPSR
jgi:flagellar biosynthesis/type III secretory pathway protein FliH